MLNFNPVSEVYIEKYALATGTVEKLMLYMISEFTKIMSTMETVQNTFSKQKCIENFVLGQLAKRLFKRRVILVQLKEYTMLVKKLHHVFRVFFQLQKLFLLSHEWIRIPTGFIACSKDGNIRID